MRFFKKIMYCFNKILDDYMAEIATEKPGKTEKQEDIKCIIRISAL